jgi:hypothetical protein
MLKSDILVIEILRGSRSHAWASPCRGGELPRDVRDISGDFLRGVLVVAWLAHI